MTKQEWEELAELSKLTRGTANKMQMAKFRDLLMKTKTIIEHPKGYKGSCYCKFCERM